MRIFTLRIKPGLLLASLLFIAFQAFAVTAFFADCQSNNDMLEKVVSGITKFKPEAVFIGGDITYYGSIQHDFDRFFEIMQPLSAMAMVYPAMGNHDNDTDLFLKNFPQMDTLTYYAVENEGVVWLVLNSNLKLAPGSAQYNWLVQNLEANKDRTLILVMHHPVYSSGPHSDEKGFSFLLPALLEQYPVAAVLSGHDHIYERSVRDSIQYVVFGGGGGKLYDNVSMNKYSKVFRKTNGFLIFDRMEDTMLCKAFDIDGKEIDRFSFEINTRPKEENRYK